MVYLMSCLINVLLKHHVCNYNIHVHGGQRRDGTDYLETLKPCILQTYATLRSCHPQTLQPSISEILKQGILKHRNPKALQTPNSASLNPCNLWVTYLQSRVMIVIHLNIAYYSEYALMR